MSSRILGALVFSFFFFQAEDGIRDGRVTGVQTCALPILGDALPNYPGHRCAESLRIRKLTVVESVRLFVQIAEQVKWFHADVGSVDASLERSEERRVGKECRSRWWPDH